MKTSRNVDEMAVFASRVLLITREADNGEDCEDVRVVGGY
jgi:hypothetical protein